MSRRLRMIVSLACALLALLACGAYGRSVRAEADRERADTLKRYGGEVVTLVVARRAIAAGETVQAGDVDLRDWISSLAPEGAILSVDEVVGCKASVPIASNAPLCELNFRDESTIAEIPAGHVAVSVPITDKLGVTSSITVGSRVVAYRALEGTAELIGGNVLVLAVPGGVGSSFSQGSITIAVTADHVPAVLAAASAGDLRLVVPASDVDEHSFVPERATSVRPETPTDDGADNAASAGPATDPAPQQQAQDAGTASQASSAGRTDDGAAANPAA